MYSNEILTDIQNYFRTNLKYSKTGYNKSILNKMSNLYKTYLSQFYDKFNANMIKDILNLYVEINYCKFCGKVLKLDYQSVISDEKFYTRKYCNSSCQMSDTDFYIQYKEKTGYDKPQDNPKTWENRIKNYQEKHGYDNPMENPKVMELRKKLHNENYGVNFPFEREEVKQKICETLTPRRKQISTKSRQKYFEKTGFYNPMQNPKVFSSRVYKRKKYILPSGKIIKYQGYENVAITEKLKEHNESELIFDANHIPRIEYENTVKNRISIYYPDLYIPKENLIIEVKSSWTYKADYELNILKRDACINQGYNFQFWICSDSEVLEILSYQAGK
jgi:hypothetical protein